MVPGPDARCGWGVEAAGHYHLPLIASSSWKRVATPRSAVAAAIRRRTVRTHATAADYAPRFWS